MNMEYPEVLFSELKSLRLEKQWSQDMLAEMTGLSVRTIQRIEQGHKASLESTKALNTIFQVQFVYAFSEVKSDDVVERDMDQLKQEKEEYSKEVKEFMNQAMVAAGCILVALVVSIMIESWHFIIWTVVGWAVVLLEKGRRTFSFIGDRIEERLTEQKFGDKKTH